MRMTRRLGVGGASKKMTSEGTAPRRNLCQYQIIHAPQFPASLLDLRVDIGFLVRASHTLQLSPSHNKITSSSFRLWEPTPLRQLSIYKFIKAIISGATPKSKSSLTSALLSLCIHYSTRLLSCQVLYFSEKILDENLVKRQSNPE